MKSYSNIDFYSKLTLSPVKRIKRTHSLCDRCNVYSTDYQKVYIFVIDNGISLKKRPLYWGSKGRKHWEEKNSLNTFLKS